VTIYRDFRGPPLDLNGANILVTGGTGSFGKAFIRTVLRDFDPERLIVFSRDELKQFDMQQDPDLKGSRKLRFFIGDVRDRDRLEMALRDVDFVIHAAAMKQIPAAEYNPFECVQTNIHGAENLVNAAIRTGVKKVIALSTDKAASPINLYGATKLASDKIFVAANHLAGKTGPRFSVVRYGNVIGSRGSVIPFFRKLLAEGETSLPITDARMTRFWITLQQGVQFVLSSMALARGGEIFIPKLPSMTMPDLAEAIAPGVSQRVVGIRPGEKLHEVMIASDDARSTLSLDDRYIIEPQFADYTREQYPGQETNRVPEDFVYSSDKNDEWLDGEGLNKLLTMPDS
jgi:UDP-N-acetylglucosamine 4,6-dehydratase/5-epimerase